MRALALLTLAVAMILPAEILLQLPRGELSLISDASGITLGFLGAIAGITGFALALWRLWRGH